MYLISEGPDYLTLKYGNMLKIITFVLSLMMKIFMNGKV